LQPITEQRDASQKATHILLPDGQIAVIIDPSSLQQVNEVNVQPKLYLSPNGSLQTLQSLDQSQLGLSPMLTATSASSNTFQSEMTINLDMWGNKVVSSVRQPGNNVGNQGNGSGSNLSAYGSDESIPSAPTQGHYQQLNQGQVHSMNHQPWSIEINQSQLQQHQVNSSLSDQELYRYDGRPRTASGGNYRESSNQYLAAGALSLSAQMAQDHQSNSPYRASMSNSRVHGGSGHERGESSDGLTEMTSALLTMMDRHDSSDEIKSHASQNFSQETDRRMSSTPQSQSSVPNLYSAGAHNGATHSPARPRPPPGMSSLQQAAYRSGSYEDSHNLNTSRPPQGGNYIQPSMSNAWGENAPRF
jgi:hypothetical protein